jgi:hypothetical protein
MTRGLLGAVALATLVTSCRLVVDEPNERNRGNWPDPQPPRPSGGGLGGSGHGPGGGAGGSGGASQLPPVQPMGPNQCSSDAACGAGLVCDRVLGACARPGGGCGSAVFTPPRAAGEMVLVLDRSNSMRDRTPSGTKWADLTGALEEVLARRGDVAWGLSMFPASDSRACQTAPVRVMPASGTAAAILAAIRAASPTGAGTPTREAIAEAGRHLLASTRPGRKYILLATDGDPNCAVGAADSNDPDVPATTQVIRQLAERGVTTFVLGVAVRPESRAALTSMAEAGGHARQRMVAYYAAADVNDLEAALDQVARQVALCTFDLVPPPPAGTTLELTIGGRPFPRAPSRVGDGWDITSAGKAIALYGAACEAVQGGATVSARYSCASGMCDQGKMACVPLPAGVDAAPPQPPPDAAAPPDAAVGGGGAGGGAGGAGGAAGGAGGAGGGGGGAAGGGGGAGGAGGAGGTCGGGTCGGVDRRCRYDAQCGPGGRCEGGACRRPCASNADCGTGDECASGHCRPGTGTTCGFNSECPAGKSCVNGVCHAPCSATMPCPSAKDRCDRGLCRPDTGRVASCRAKADCPAGIDCVDGLCRMPCCFDSDCATAASGPICWTGYCFKRNEAEPACFLDPDCGDNRTCADAICR